MATLFLVWAATKKTLFGRVGDVTQKLLHLDGHSAFFGGCPNQELGKLRWVILMRLCAKNLNPVLDRIMDLVWNGSTERRCFGE
jgi:hypothetical protein